jgi:hypothetical protein
MEICTCDVAHVAVTIRFVSRGMSSGLIDIPIATATLANGDITTSRIV